MFTNYIIANTRYWLINLITGKNDKEFRACSLETNISYGSSPSDVDEWNKLYTHPTQENHLVLNSMNPIEQSLIIHHIDQIPSYLSNKMIGIDKESIEQTLYSNKHYIEENLIHYKE